MGRGPELLLWPSHVPLSWLQIGKICRWPANVVFYHLFGWYCGRATIEKWFPGQRMPVWWKHTLSGAMSGCPTWGSCCRPCPGLGWFRCRCRFCWQSHRRQLLWWQSPVLCESNGGNFPRFHAHLLERVDPLVQLQITRWSCARGNSARLYEHGRFSAPSPKFDYISPTWFQIHQHQWVCVEVPKKFQEEGGSHRRPSPILSGHISSRSYFPNLPLSYYKSTFT